MADGTPEIESTPQEPEYENGLRIVNLKEEFPITEAGKSRNKFLLKINEEIKIPIDVSVSLSKASKSSGITPYHPDNGYQIDERDYNLTKRKAKIDEIAYEKIDSKDPTSICIDSSEYELNKYGLSNKLALAGHEFKPQIKRIMELLRVRLSFPGTPELTVDDPNYLPPSFYNSRINPTSIYLGRIWFREFHPNDRGPLAHNDSKLATNDLHEQGMLIYIPPDKISEVMAKFYLEEPQEELEEISETPSEEPSTPISGGFIRSRR